MTQPDSAQVEPPVPADGAAPTTEPVAETEEQFLQLRRNNLYADLSKYESEDEEVRRVIGSYVGNKASRQYKPEIQRRDAEIAQLKTELFNAEVRGMDEKAIETKVSTDRDWGKRYLDYVHEQRNGKQPEPIDDRPLVEAALSEIMDYGRRNGMTDADWNKFVAKAQSGGYGTDAWQVSITRMQQDVADFVRTAKPAAPAIQKTNPALARGGPDLTSGDRTGAGVSGAFPTSAKEFNSLPRAKQQELLATDREKIVALSNK